MRVFILIVGSATVILGAVSMVTPIPGGTLLIAIGAGMVICSSHKAAAFVKVCREKFRRFNQLVTWLEDRIGKRLSEPLRRTRPTASSGGDSV